MPIQRSFRVRRDLEVNILLLMYTMEHVNTNLDNIQSASVNITLQLDHRRSDANDHIVQGVILNHAEDALHPADPYLRC